MKLLTKELAAKLPPLYANEKQGEEALALVKFFTPDSSWTWYASEACAILSDGREVPLNEARELLYPVRKPNTILHEQNVRNRVSESLAGSAASKEFVGLDAERGESQLERGDSDSVRVRVPQSSESPRTVREA